jgi:hypothetical protein
VNHFERRSGNQHSHVVVHKAPTEENQVARLPSLRMTSGIDQIAVCFSELGDLLPEILAFRNARKVLDRKAESLAGHDPNTSAVNSAKL